MTGPFHSLDTSLCRSNKQNTIIYLIDRCTKIRCNKPDNFKTIEKKKLIYPCFKMRELFQKFSVNSGKAIDLSVLRNVGVPFKSFIAVRKFSEL